jgi:hypothetical protein
MRGAIRPLPPHVFMVWCSLKAQRQFSFTFASSGSHVCPYIPTTTKLLKWILIIILTAVLHVKL